MTTDHNLDALLDETTPALRSALQAAYDLGYRAALAAVPAPAATGAQTGAPLSPSPSEEITSLSTAAPMTVDDDDLEPDNAPPSAAPPPLGDDEDEDEDSGSSQQHSVDWSALDNTNAPPPRRAPRPVIRPIRPHATVGTLRRRIVTGFELERFDIDVVICRKGDRTRRQLKQTVKLSKYALEAT